MSKKNRKRKLEGEEQSIVDWEQENIFPDEIRNVMESMWEIPQIFHFLYLAKEALNIPHLSMYEMERMLLIPRASKQLANIMTSLLSSSATKAKLRKIPPMPYEFWTNILAYKMKSWFKVYEGKHRDAVKVLETIGVEPEFWNVFPDAPLLNGKDFEELTFKQRVWLLKTVCDTVMHTRKTVQEEIAKQPWEDQFETVLGTDRHGARYIYFPQFIKSDLRVYRHCLDNKILSTVKPIKPKLKINSESNVMEQHHSMKKKTKQKRRKSRWSNGLPPKSKKKVTKYEKRPNDCKCTSDSATGSLINEDTNMSSTSSCSNNNSNNSSNKRNIDLDVLNMKMLRSSKHSTSTESRDTHDISLRSSGYDTNSTVRAISNKKSSQKMFKGFSNANNDKCNIKIINGILSDLKANDKEEKGTDDIEISLMHNSQDTLELKSVDNVSSISKTDDEKLNEIISAECLKLGDKSSNNFQISITSKSDDEKLSETRTGHSAVDEDNTSLVQEQNENKIIKQNGQFVKEEKPKILKKNIDSTKTEFNDDKDLSLSELRSMLQKEAMEDDFSFDEDSEMGCNVRKAKGEKPDGWKQEVEDFNEMLSELSVSEFQLIADSVSALRDLISSFSQESNSNHTNSVDDANDTDNEPVPPCEAKLIKNMTELLSSLEEMESSLRESMKKARGKLQKEWTNFKEGVEDQDSSGEGLGSNWWVLGSQGCPLPTSGDATLQTLPHFTLSPAGSQNTSTKKEDHQEESVDRAEHNKDVEQKCKEHQSESTEGEAQKGQSERSENNSQENTRAEEETKEDASEEEQQTRRVLRARGISSYTEQLYSDDEIEENELEEWADVEAVYAAPSTQIGAPTAYVTPKVKHSDDRTNEEDSDQDWILPSSRKRKNKRPSANRRLKSFQHKLQCIKVDELQEAAESLVVSASTDEKNNRLKPKIKHIQICKPKKPTEPQASSADSLEKNQEAVVENDPKETAVPSTETTCKVENIVSVHSELDIKDEGPIYDSSPCQYDNNNYSTNINSNYLMLKTDQNPMNYYVMQPNPTGVVSQNAIVQPGPVVPNIVPPIQQGYYVQGGQNYIFQNSQPSFVPPQTFQPQGPQMIAPQQFVSHPGYVPYMMTAPQSGFVTTNSQIVTQGIPHASSIPVYSNPTIPTRAPQIRYPTPRQNYPHPNGAVIRSSMPIKAQFPRNNNVKLTRNIPQQRGTPVRLQKPRNQTTTLENINQKTTSLIVLSDSDDEIEMIITEKTNPETEAEKAKNTPRKNNIAQTRQKVPPKAASPKNAISPQIIQRMNQGGISITPVKPAPPVQNASTQLVVVVNETGSHYALALPNGSKLILTPEQVAQIRASNGGKLIL